MHRNLRALLALAACTGAAHWPGLLGASGTTSIVGRVVDATTGRPIAGATVRMAADTSTTRSTQTDSRGTFSFAAVAEGDYELRAIHTNFVEGRYAQRRPGDQGQRLRVASEPLRRIELHVWRHAVITGRVTESGDPLVGAWAHALRASYVDGRVRYVVVRSSRVDDRGEYRLSQLIPGTFLVVVAGPSSPGTRLVPDQTPEDFGTTYFPNGRSASEAQALTVAPGEVRHDVDIHVTTAGTVTLSGRVIAPDGIAAGTHVWLRPSGAAGTDSDLDLRTVRADDAGRFEFPGVAPGPYEIGAAQRVGGADLRGPLVGFTGSHVAVAFRPSQADMTADPAAAGPMWTGRVEVSVSTEPPPVAVSIARGRTLRGVFRTADGRTGVPAGSTRTLALFEPLSPVVLLAHPPATIQDDGSFTTAELPPGRYRFRPLRLPAPWRVDVIRQGGVDVRYRGIEIPAAGDVPEVTVVIADAGATVTGIVRNPQETAGAAFASVVLFPADRTLWNVPLALSHLALEVRTSHDGDFRLADVPAGDYFIAAVDAGLPQIWQRSSYLAALAGIATRIRVDARSTQTHYLTLHRAPQPPPAW